MVRGTGKRFVWIDLEYIKQDVGMVKIPYIFKDKVYQCVQDSFYFREYLGWLIFGFVERNFVPDSVRGRITTKEDAMPFQKLFFIQPEQLKKYKKKIINFVKVVVKSFRYEQKYVFEAVVDELSSNPRVVVSLAHYLNDEAHYLNNDLNPNPEVQDLLQALRKYFYPPPEPTDWDNKMIEFLRRPLAKLSLVDRPPPPPPSPWKPLPNQWCFFYVDKPFHQWKKDEKTNLSRLALLRKRRRTRF